MPVLIEKYESKKAKNGFMYRYIIPRNLDYGIEKPIKKRGFSTKREAKEAGELVLHEIMNGQRPDSRRITLDDVWQEYLELESARVSKGTISVYTSIYKNHIQPELGSKLIRSLDYKALQAFMNKVSPSRASGIKQVINILFALAVRLGYIPFSPTHEVKLPKNEKKKKEKNDFIEPERLIQILEDLNQEEYKRLIWTGYYLGLRLGEAMALEWKDIDLKAAKVKIRQQMLSSSEITSRLKTKASYAVLPIAAPLLEMMKDWKKDECPYVVHDAYGNRKKYDAVEQRFVRIPNFHFHALRHTFITNLIEAGVPVKTVMTLARHSSIQTTLAFYTEVTEEMMENAIFKTFPNLPQI